MPQTTPMILSLQSHVVYGQVGNRAAVFPLQRMGFQVNVINTVQFSNHTGYTQFTGQAFSATHIADLLEGLKNIGVLNKHAAVLSGYLGGAEVGNVILDAVKQIKQSNPAALYCCDPVMGDVDIGIFVKPDILPFFHSALRYIDVLTPNLFELSLLVNRPLKTLTDITYACDEIRAQGPKIILVTSLVHESTPPRQIQMLASAAAGNFLVSTPRFDFEHPSSGAGDATAAIFLGTYLKTRDVKEALEHTTGAIYALFKKTYDAGTREIQLIAAQDELVCPTEKFTATSPNQLRLK
jgi:pyridoxine kinase